MKLLRTLALPLFCVVPLACRSNATHANSMEVPCICGQPEADIQGCAHHACMSGQRNHDNPDCVCGTLSIPKSK